ncbi:MAG: chemotaxis protein CheA, partial [Solirubrobacteraceae bacterium]
PQTVPAVGGWRIRFRPRPALYRNANEPALLLRELARLGPMEVELDESELPLLPDLDPEGAYLAWTVQLLGAVDEAAVKDVFEFVEGDCDLEIDALTDAEPVEPAGPPTEADPAELDIAALIGRAQAEVAAVADAPSAEASSQPAATPARPPSSGAQPGASARAEAKAGATIRVDLDRVDRLIDLVGELVINQAVLAQRVLEAGLARASDVAMGLDELEQLTRSIQDSVMAIRAQPVKSVFQRMPRLVRELAMITRKQARLVTSGEATEVDKTVIERLTDPLTHMIRNAIDHGLETPEARVAAGKNPEGLVRLSALHRSGRIVIEVEDDGAGIDR